MKERRLAAWQQGIVTSGEGSLSSPSQREISSDVLTLQVSLLSKVKNFPVFIFFFFFNKEKVNH